MVRFIRQLNRVLLGYIGIQLPPRIAAASVHPLMQTASISRADFVVSVTAEKNTIIIGVSARRSVSPEAVDNFMTRLASAVAEAETIDKEVMEESLFADRQVIRCATSLGVVMRREFSDPEYPHRVDREIRRWLQPTAMQSVLVC